MELIVTVNGQPVPVDGETVDIHVAIAAVEPEPEPEPPSGTALAALTLTQPDSTLLAIDTAGSVGTLALTVDGTPVALDDNGQVLVGPLALGAHEVQLEATSDDGHDAVAETVEIVWTGYTVVAQHDNANALEGSGAELEKWEAPVIQPDGPWRNIQVLNHEGDGGDGAPRIGVNEDGSFWLLTKYGDHPGTTGGYRSALEFNTAYDPRAAGHPLAVRTLDLCGNDGTPRIAHLEFRLDPSTPLPLLHQNNFVELHGNIGGQSPWRIQPYGNGIDLGVAFVTIVNGEQVGGIQWFASQKIVVDRWYDFDVEWCLSLDPEVGYFRVFNNGEPATKVPPATLPDGRFMAITQQTDRDGNVVPMAFDIQNYRTGASMPADYPDVTIHYRNISISAA